MYSILYIEHHINITRHGEKNDDDDGGDDDDDDDDGGGGAGAAAGAGCGGAARLYPRRGVTHARGNAPHPFLRPPMDGVPASDGKTSSPGPGAAAPSGAKDGPNRGSPAPSIAASKCIWPRIAMRRALMRDMAGMTR